jgi:hypothetical protein
MMSECCNMYIYICIIVIIRLGCHDVRVLYICVDKARKLGFEG